MLSNNNGYQYIKSLMCKPVHQNKDEKIFYFQVPYFSIIIKSLTFVNFKSEMYTLNFEQQKYQEN